jgi:hypothetical protein
MIESMDSKRFAALVLAAGLALPAAAYNHVNTVAPKIQGPFNVACSNVAQDASRVAAGLIPADYWEGRGHYVTELLSERGTAITYSVRAPFDPFIYPGNFGRNVEFAAVVCYPTPRTNNDPNYTLPGSGDTVFHMQRPGDAPKLLSANEYFTGIGVAIDPPLPAGIPAKIPLIMYSHGLGGSPISSGYLETIALLASHGFMVAAVFHGDSRFSPIRVETLGDAAFLLAGFNFVVEMTLMRPLSLIGLADKLLDNPDYAVGIDPEQIGGFGASLGGEAMLHLMGAKITSTLGFTCSNAPSDPRIKAAVGFVPYAGQTFLPSFCDGQSGVDSIDKPFLAMSGTADTTAPIKMVDSALRRMKGSRYLIELAGVPHEFKAEYAGDLMTWTVAFYRAHLQNDVGVLDTLTRMNSVQGGPSDRVRLDYYVPRQVPEGYELAREYRNTILNHYFIASNPGEIANLDSGRAGAGWVRTGPSFKVVRADPLALPPQGLVPVCRFYAPSPNSHFYTAVVPECEFVKSGAAGGWFYEGTAFFTMSIDAQQRCPLGFIGVNRAYNGRAPQNDSNHRFSTSDSTMRDMAGEGWAYEATVMCAQF